MFRQLIVLTAVVHFQCTLSSFSHRLALVSNRSAENPAHYLEADDRMLSVMSGAPPSSMLVLCVHMPGQALLEIIDSIRQNVSYCASGQRFCDK